MTQVSRTRNRAFVISGLGIALLVAVFLSPFASSKPTGIDRVAQEQGFEDKAVEKPPSHHLPFYRVFDEYQLRGVPQQVATPVAGLIGTLVTFGLAWGAGKILVRDRES
jgi:cobalt/nickel transport protein